MPTSDPVKRRFQNRDNQKRFRERQTKQLTELRAAHDVQEERLKELEATVDALRKQNVDAEARMQELRQVNSLLDQRLHTVNRLAVRWKSDADELLGLANADTADIQNDKNTHPSHNAELPIDGISIQEHSSDSAPVEEALQPHQGPVNEVILPLEENWQGIDFETLEGGSSDPQEELWGNILEIHATRPQTPVTATALAAEVNLDFLSFPADTPEAIDMSWELNPNLPLTVLDGGDMPAPDFGLGTPHSPFNYFSGQEPYISHALTNYDLTSRISRHIHAASSVIHQRVSTLQPGSTWAWRNVTERAIAWMAQKSWPKSVDCLKLMTVYQHWFDFELWRNFPCQATYYNIHPQYRPGPIQLLVPHHPAIDWLPWPKLREKAIEHQDEIDVDLLHMTALQHTIIERDVTPGEALADGSGTNALVDQTYVGGQRISFRAWDIYQLEKAAGIAFPPSNMTHQPTSSFVLALINKYGLGYADISRLRLDPAFFEIFPQLYIAELVSNCLVGSPPHSELDLVEYPSDLDAESLTSLHSEVEDALVRPT